MTFNDDIREAAAKRVDYELLAAEWRRLNPDDQHPTLDCWDLGVMFVKKYGDQLWP